MSAPGGKRRADARMIPLVAILISRCRYGHRNLHPPLEIVDQAALERHSDSIYSYGS
jgi:hypothetical protein